MKANLEVVADDEWQELRQLLAARGVAGAEDLGRFVSNTEFFAASGFDERAALLEYLPTATDPRLVTAIAGHLRRAWARPVAFHGLREAFERWAVHDPTVGWALGDALATAATLNQLDDLIGLVLDRKYGRARQMLVYALPRFKRSPRVLPVLMELSTDEDVALHAMTGLRRVLGAEAALPLLEAVRAGAGDTALADVARREIAKAHRSMRDNR